MNKLKTALVDEHKNLNILTPYEGEVELWQPGLIGYWEPRYATLEHKKFKYFRDQESIEPLAIINFDQFEIIHDDSMRDGLQFSL